MKKIYSKITKERRKQFRIETCIIREEGKCQVRKKALSSEGTGHIGNMYRYYEEHKALHMLCAAEMLSENEIAFEFLQGKSLCSELLETLAEWDETGFLSLLRVYGEIVRKNVQTQKQIFVPDESFIEVFGDVSFEEEMECAAGLNIDMTFDNIIKDASDGFYKMIDYEWVFSFPIPVKFVIYRAVLAFYTKYASTMKDMITLDEIYKCFGITAGQTAVFSDMNAAFNRYVYGDGTGYNTSVSAYKKEVFDVKKLLPEEHLFLQVFFNDGNSYAEEKAVTKELTGKKAAVTIPVPEYETISEVRIDPVNVSCAVRDLSVTVRLKDGSSYKIENCHHNAVTGENGVWIFCSEDPQIIFENQWEDRMEQICVEFSILDAGLLEHPLRQALEQEHSELLKVQDELNLIKNSHIYKLLMEKKIDKILGENE